MRTVNCVLVTVKCAVRLKISQIRPADGFADRSVHSYVVEMQRVAPVREDLRYRFRTVRNRLYGVSEDPHIKPLSRTAFIISVTEILGSLEPGRFGLVGHILKSITEWRHRVSARSLGLSQDKSQDKITSVERHSLIG